MRILILPIVVAVLWSTCCDCTVQAQDPRQQRRRAFVEDLLKTLIESQIEPDRPSDHDHGQPGQHVRPTLQVSPTMLQAREQLRVLSGQAEHVVFDLRNEDADIPQVRALVGDALQIKANVDLLYRKSLQLPVVEPLLPEFQIIDRDWRVLHHRLSQLNSLSPSCRKCIATFNQYENGLCTLLKVQPQFDRREVGRLMNAFSNDLEHLIQDIYYDFRSDPTMPAIIRKGQALRAQINQAAALIPRGNYESIAAVYQSSSKEWRLFSRQMRKFSSDRLDRDLQSIEVHDRQIRELLWLPSEIDRAYVVHVTDSIGKNVEKLFREITLEQMLKCSKPVMLISNARKFQNQCIAFSKSVVSGAPQDGLVWDFRAFEVQWEELHQNLHELESQRMTNRVSEIENSLSVLRETFGEGPEINRATLIQIAGSLDQLTAEFAREVHFRIKEPQYKRDFHEQFCGASDDLSRRVRELHQKCMSRSRDLNVQNELKVVFAQWTNVKNLMNRCQDADRIEIAKHRRQIEPLMVKLQVVYAG